MARIDTVEQLKATLGALDISFSEATNFDLRISKKAAEYLVRIMFTSTYTNLAIMCKEYGQDEDWNEVYYEDLNDENESGEMEFDTDYKTFEIWI